ncbi:MAG: HAMP domain-containing protein, partial [FCB group bacterium]|nr:HAMP domain-containing protein [FCB group bacterium]
MERFLGWRAHWNRLLWRLLSVPLYTKILSIVILGAAIFGSITLYQVWSSMHRVHREMAQERAENLAISLTGQLENVLAAKDLAELQERAELAVAIYPECAFVEVVRPNGEIVARAATLQSGSSGQALPQYVTARTLVNSDATGQPLTLRVGMEDESSSRELYSIFWPLFWTLAFCLLVSEVLAVLMARVVAGPIRSLMQTTHRVRTGDFEARAKVYADDEVGQLAEAFNQMAESLQAYRTQIQEKDAVRVQLLGKIVQAQEDERKVVSRELHDQLGQSLSKVLLSLHSAFKECGCVNMRCGTVENEVRDAIDEVRRLAWAMRPSILDDFGIDSALERYLQELQKRVEFVIDYRCVARPDAPRMPQAVEVTLYRVAQEAMTNIIRHAHPAHASVVLLRPGT